MRILFLTSGPLVPSSRFRVLQYVPYLRERGHDCRVLPSRPPKYRSVRCLGHRLSCLLRRYHRRRELKLAEQADVVFLERELFSDESTDFEVQFRRRASAFVWDVDDGLFVLHPEKCKRLAGLCDLAIAGNRFLQKRLEALGCTTVVIPTVVDLTRYAVPAVDAVRISDCNDRPVVLGWTGTAANIEYLSLIREPLSRLAKQYAIELVVVAERQQPLRRIGLQGIPVRFVRWSEQDEIADLRQFDIGLMPMPDAQWTRFKCGLKILQYMAMGIPAVASPVGVNADLIQHGVNGFLAESNDQWFGVLEQLVENADQRRQIGQRGRQTVKASYSVDVTLDRLIESLESVCSTDSSASSAGQK